MSYNTVRFAVTCILFSFSIIEGAKVLIIPYSFNSHVSALASLGEGLMRNGHDVHLFISPTMPGIEKYRKGKINLIEYNAKDPDLYSIIKDEKTQADFQEQTSKISLIANFRTIIHGFIEMCTNPLSDQEVFLRMKSMKFDIAIVDVFPLARCILPLVERLGLPFVVTSICDEPWLHRNPALPSAWPTNMAPQPHTEKMGFWERLQNVWDVFDWAAFTGVPYLEDDFLREYFYETEPVPLNKLIGKAELWLLEFNLMLEYPRPRMANEFYIGGLTTKPAKPLNDDFEMFVNSSQEGVVIMSFGSMGAYLPQRAWDELFEACRRIKYNVIVRCGMESPSNIPTNVKLSKWIPQNDLLGHKNIKLFVTHSGANSQNEALYHGVPMIGLPIFAEQPHNALRVAYHGYGKMLNFKTFTGEELATAINDVISNKSYAENIAKASLIFHDQPMTPGETALYWIEHVIKYGGKHLRSHALDMPWYEYLMLDILAFVIVMSVLSQVLVIVVLRKMYMYLIGKTKAKTD